MRFGLLVSFAWLAGVALAQRTDAMFDQNCASCHEVGSTANSAKVPDRKAISKLTTEAIYASLTTGSMKDRAHSLTDPQKRRLAEFLGGLRKLGAVEAGVETGSAARMPNRCPDNPPLGDISSSPSWNGWSTDGTNTRFQFVGKRRYRSGRCAATEAEMGVWATGSDSCLRAALRGGRTRLRHGG